MNLDTKSNTYTKNPKLTTGFWNIVGPDLCLAVEWFFHHASFPVGCNSSFIALIPKTLNLKSVDRSPWNEHPFCTNRMVLDQRGFFGVSVTKLSTGRLVNRSSCNGIDMVIKDLDLEPKVDAMMRDFL
nr:transposon TX1 putative 149 kDa protein [Tanacetum cinerariifolium]